MDKWKRFIGGQAKGRKPNLVPGQIPVTKPIHKKGFRITSFMIN
jgi:hypothetical protein